MTDLILTEGELETLSNITNTLRGMNFDRRIPPDTMRCIQNLVIDLDTICERLIGNDDTMDDDDWDEEPDPDLLREDRDDRRLLARENGDA